MVLQAGLQLLQDLAALLQRRRVPVREGPVVDSEAPLLVDVQQGGDSVPLELCPGAEHKHFLHPLVLELLWWEKTSNADASPQECVKTHNQAWKKMIFGGRSRTRAILPTSLSRLLRTSLYLQPEWTRT